MKLAHILTICAIAMHMQLTAQNKPPVCKPDTMYLGKWGNVLDNDYDPNKDKISVLYFFVGSTKYTARTTSYKINGRDVGIKPTGEVYTDTALTISYTISDGHYGTCTTQCTIVKPAVPKPIVRPPVAVSDIYIISASKLKKGDTILNVFVNDTIQASDSFRIIYWIADGGAYPMSMSLGTTKYSEPVCSFGANAGIFYNKGCLQARSNGMITWGPNNLEGTNTNVQVIDAVYIAQDKKGRLIGGSVTIIINP